MSESRDLVRDDALEPTDVIPFVATDSGTPLVNIHRPTECAGRPCCIHAPSAHPLRDAPLYWRGDRRFMERTLTSSGSG